MTSHERLAIGSLLVTALAGHGIRRFLLDDTQAPGQFSFRSTAPAARLIEQRARVAKLSRPLAPTERINLNQAGPEEIARLPKIGVPLAKAIIKRRTATGGFGSMAELDAVPGVGPGLLAQIQPHVTLGDTDRVRAARTTDPRPVLPPVVLVGSPRPARSRAADRSVSGPVHLNSATQAELETLSGIGPGRAKRILAYRQTYGPFASAADLGKVPGIPPKLVTQLLPQVVVP